MEVVLLHQVLGLTPNTRGSTLTTKIALTEGLTTNLSFRAWKRSGARLFVSSMANGQQRLVERVVPLSWFGKMRPYTYYRASDSRDKWLESAGSASAGRHLGSYQIINRETARLLSDYDCLNEGIFSEPGDDRIPSHAYFLVVEDAERRVRVMVPGSEIVRIFYAASMPFLEALYRGDLLDCDWRQAYPKVAFDGSRFVARATLNMPSDEVVDPERTSKALRRLFNRAHRLGRVENDLVPFVAYPPIDGPVLLTGRGDTFASADGFTTYCFIRLNEALVNPIDLRLHAAFFDGEDVILHGLPAIPNDYKSVLLERVGQNAPGQ